MPLKVIATLPAQTPTRPVIALFACPCGCARTWYVHKDNWNYATWWLSRRRKCMAHAGLMAYLRPTRDDEYHMRTLMAAGYRPIRLGRKSRPVGWRRALVRLLVGLARRER